MNYFEFRENFSQFHIFSVGDVLKLYPKFDSRRLVEWQKKGYIQKLINKWYLFTETSLTEELRIRIANCLQRPSYVSLEYALSWYGLIPEAVYSTTSITTRKTVLYETSVGTFQYQSVKPHLYFGYHVDHIQELPVLIADPEKAILDYLYLHNINNTDEMEAIRLNEAMFRESIDMDKLTSYARCFESATLNRRVKLLQKLFSYA